MRIASQVGAQLRNMQYAWMCPVPLEKALRRSRPQWDVLGRRRLDDLRRQARALRCNEKLPYNELAQVFFEWDGDRRVPEPRARPGLGSAQSGQLGERRVRAADRSSRWRRPPRDQRQATLDELVVNIAGRLEQYAAVTGGLALSDDFGTNLATSIERFNGFAAAGRDEDFGRGERAISFVFNGDVKEEPGRDNVTMWPISTSGPYCAALVTGGTLDTKGGPKTSGDGQVLDDLDSPIAGLYGVGNCVASPSARAYWAGGATLGPILAMAHRAATAANAETPERLETSAAQSR